MRKIFCILCFQILTISVLGQGIGIPSKKGGIGFGNLPVFTGLRFNYRDKNVEKINGINVTIWQSKDEDSQTGKVNGLSIGLPLAIGTEFKNGVTLGILGVGANKSINGINIGGLGVGAGDNIVGINIGGLGVGSGGDLVGINIGGLGAGSGGDVKGFALGGLGIGAGETFKGVGIGGLGVGSGGNATGILVGGLGVGAGENLRGLSIGGLGVGAGGNVSGISISGLAVGSGNELKGLAIAGIAVGSPKVSAIAIAPVVGGIEVRGLIVAPALTKIGYSNKNSRNADDEDFEKEGSFTGISISAFNYIKGDQNGVAIGVVNSTRRIKGVQFGLINIVRENPRGLRVLPIFNTRFRK